MSDPRHDERDIDIGDIGPFSFFGASTFKPWPSIAHYYGDVVRQFMLAGAALMLAASPLYGDNLRIEFPFEVAGALIAAAFAALTNPRGRSILTADTVIAGVGTVVYAAWGIFEYDTISPVAFVLRLVIAIIFLFAFYFSLKTVRAIALHEIGKRESIDEFEEESVRVQEEALERETMIRDDVDAGAGIRPGHHSGNVD